jgi:hypothetical protein
VPLGHIQYPVAVTPEDITGSLVNGKRLLTTMQQIFLKNLKPMGKTADQYVIFAG